MLKSVRYLVIGLILSFAAANTVVAQNHPMPGSKNEAPVICAGCPWSNASGQPNDGLPTYPYSGVLLDHVGRYVDSSSVQSYQMWAGGFRTARARFIRVAPTTRGSAPPRIYIQIGNAMAAYSLDTFFTTRLPGGMVSIATRFGNVGPGREKFLDWDAFVYPEYATSGWQTDGGDFQDPMSKGVPFDWDDRGYVYVATEKFGWAIVTDDGRTNGTHLSKVIQFVATPKPEFTKVLANTTKVNPASIVSLKVGGAYYVLTADRDSQMSVWNATDVNRPTAVSIRKDDKGNAIRAMARDDNTKRLAYIDNNFQVRIFSYEGIVGGTAPLAEFAADSGSFGEVISMDDAGNVWAIDASGKIYKFSPSGDTYTKQVFAPFPERFTPLIMNVNAGYLVVGGIDWAASTYDVKILRVEPNGVTNLNVDNFFRKYYHQAPPNYAQPGSYTSIQAQSADVEVIKWGGKTYLLYSGFGLGDVFELEGGNSININLKGAPFGTPNPNAKSTETGPFYADPVTFVANSSSQSVNYDVVWNFANPESGSLNTGRSRTGEDETHQFSGLTTAGAITAVKAVKAQATTDVNIQAQHNLTLKLPKPRVGVSSFSTPVSADTNGLELVYGDTFNDASDGAVEGHVSVWTIDGVVTSTKPDQSVSATGGIGAHTLKFHGAYGPYDANLNVATPYVTPDLTVAYVVKPFKATINAPTADATNATFTASGRYTTNTTILNATTWDVVWTVNGTAQNSGVSTSAVGIPIGTIPPLVLPKTGLVDGTVIGLKINVSPSSLSPEAANYAEYNTSMVLSTPDPGITITGCGNVGSPCKFTAISTGSKSMADWTYLWTLTRPGAGTVNSTSAVFDASLTAVGNYTITLKATKGIFSQEATKQFSVEASLCGPLPQAYNVTINKAGCLSSCAPGTNIDFSVITLGYTKQACDTYSWTMGDGTTKSGESFTYSYSNPGSYTVTLTMSNSGSASPVVRQTTVSITGNTEPPPPPPNTCTAPSSITIHPSCNGSTTCKTTDTVSFIARRSGSSLQSCDSVAWSFGDGSQSALKSPTKQYSAPGTYTVTATVSNSQGSAQGTTQLTITDGSGNCSLAPSSANFVIDFVGPTSNCRTTNGTPCNGGESVAFSAINYYYAVGNCDTFEWDFADGSAKAYGREVNHAFPGGQTYAVKLKVFNNAGSYVYNRNVTVAGTAPTKPLPVITGSSFPANGIKGRTITFSATANIASNWIWNFGDGTAVDSSQTTRTSSTITHTFANRGTYTVKVSARNSEDAATAPTTDMQGSIVIADAPAIPEYKYLIPVAAYTAGQGGSAWRTDVQIYNSDPVALKMEVAFKGRTQELEMVKATHIYENFLGNLLSLWGMGDNSGPVIITTKSVTAPPQIWTRTYTQTANGTFGQFIPAIRIDNLGGGGAATDVKYHMSGLRHDDRYRTNVGFLNPNAAAITANVIVYDDRHFEIGTFPLTLQPFQLDQFQLASKVTLPKDKPFGVEIDVPAGQWLVAYASFIDGISNDPVYIQAVPESEMASTDFKTSIIPGVGHTGQWKSDVTIFNPDIKGMMFDLEYYNSAGVKKAEALSVPLEPGKFLQYADLLKQGVLGSVEDGLGTLKINVKSSHDKYPMTFARTYFDDNANGTFGQGIAGFSSARANVKPNKPAIIAGVRNTNDYYTNIGLVNLGTSDVVATVTLLDPATGAVVTAIPYTIKPAETIIGRFNGWGSITQGTFKIEANGNVWAFASVIDNRTKDPEYVPAIALP